MSGSKKVCILGASGSIGASTLSLLREFKNRFELISCSVHENTEKLDSIIQEFSPKIAVVTGRKFIGDRIKDTKIVYGDYSEAIEVADIVVAGIVGIAGLKPVVEALRAKKRVALANKESIVCGSKLLRNFSDAQIIPIDSEHASIFHCVNGRADVERVVLTASGGPFLHRSRESLKEVTAKEALNHPTWKMGGKISIDSSTMANKALEVIEAHYLFKGLPVEVVVHPESIVHGGAILKDGSFLAHGSFPDMRAPIALGLAYPDLLPNVVKPPFPLPKVSFFELDNNRFPLVNVAKSILEDSGLCLVFNSANEWAVSNFLSGRIKYLDIERVIFEALAHFIGVKYDSVEEIFNVDLTVRRWCEEKCL